MFVRMVVAVQLRVVDAYMAIYELSDPEGQIESFVNGVLRGEVPNIDIDEVFDDKEKLENAIRAHGPVTLVVNWMYADALDSSQVIAEVLNRTSPVCRYFQVLPGLSFARNFNLQSS